MKLKEDLIVRKVGEDYVIVSPDQGMMDLSKVYGLNFTAAWLWERLKGTDFEVSDMINLVRGHYEIFSVSEMQLQKDMQELVEFFKENALIEAE